MIGTLTRRAVVLGGVGSPPLSVPTQFGPPRRMWSPLRWYAVMLLFGCPPWACLRHPPHGDGLAPGDGTGLQAAARAAALDGAGR
ncbi:hypothetical protein RB614_09120 [Phytohabitans sp. ZYX-F-186]|uniref:Uncharacterized protein n=1 Tax=Phytohabitans maris TaxID=3071409 RepID=A0ABU0ZC78_9ACTN|nr:hypothetical protein [Phytohabitans sp. ZYX-F-186]MDQ7904680.1 hypothetical protein [Phytohabitans sp. ZYX-F-186]